jgi:hypothetical protein
MNNKFLAFALGFVAFTLTENCAAALISYSGSWTSSNYSAATSPDPFSGSFSFQFDDVLYTGGDATFDDIGLSSLALNPSTIGATAYGVANARGWLVYVGGSLVRVGIGGLNSLGLGANVISADTDDFLISFFADGQLADITVANSGVLDLSSPGTKSATLETVRVPEPLTATLLGIGLAGIGYQQRKRFLV